MAAASVPQRSQVIRMNHDGNAASGSSRASRPVGSAVLGSVARSRLARPAAEHHSVDKVLGLGRDLLGGHELRHLLLLALTLHLLAVGHGEATSASRHAISRLCVAIWRAHNTSGFISQPTPHCEKYFKNCVLRLRHLKLYSSGFYFYLFR